MYSSGELIQSTAVTTIELTKFFPRKKAPSVNGLTFAVQPGECFGLLGVNGAGKTTTFRMLTGALSPSLGTVFVNGFNVSENKQQAHRSLGFCPQHDALFGLLTGRETLMLYARLRGFPESHIPEVVSDLLTNMTLAPHANKIVEAYSGGNRRKLSTAIAILGSPQIIFLDEPTSGMDPVAKRFIWDQIIDLVNGGKAVILTSHSMEECEALCHRLGIMVNGQLQCLGSVQNLKARFGNGYLAEVRVNEAKEDNGDELTKQLLQKFPGTTLTNRSRKYHEYQFPLKTTQLSELFAHLNELRTFGVVEHYSVKQSTLDQVFVNFAKSQMKQNGDDAEAEIGQDVLAMSFDDSDVEINMHGTENMTYLHSE